MKSAAGKQLRTASRMEAAMPLLVEAGGDWRIVGRRGDGAAQFRSKFFRNNMGVRAVTDDLRSDEDDELGALGVVGLMTHGVAEDGDLIEHWDSVSGAALLLADQACEQNGLAVRHGD